MGSSHADELNEDYVGKISKAAESGALVVITGSGVTSSLCGNPKVGGRKIASWSGLLLHGIDFCKTKKLISSTDAAPFLRKAKGSSASSLIEVAESVTAWLSATGDARFGEWLDHSIGKLRATNHELADAIRYLKPLIVTVNYDDVLEQTLNLKTVCATDINKAREVINTRARDHVVHLHGHWKDPKSLVFGSSSYNGTVLNGGFPSLFQSIFFSHTVIFVGCGGTLEDPNLSRVAEWARVSFSDIKDPHFFLCRKSDRERYAKRFASSGDGWLTAVSYGDNHDDLPGFLRSLSPSAPVVDAPATRQETPECASTSPRQNGGHDSELGSSEHPDSWGHSSGPSAPGAPEGGQHGALLATPGTVSGSAPGHSPNQVLLEKLTPLFAKDDLIAVLVEAGIELSDGIDLPKLIASVLQSDGSSEPFDLLDTFHDLVDELVAAKESKKLESVLAKLRPAGDTLAHILAEIAQSYLNPAESTRVRQAMANGADEFIEIRASQSSGALLMVRSDVHKCWTVAINDRISGIRELKDRYVARLPTQMDGTEAEVKRQIAYAISTTFMSANESHAVSVEDMTDELIAKLSGACQSDKRRKGIQRLLFLAAHEKHFHLQRRAIAPLTGWARKRFMINIIVCQQPTEGSPSGIVVDEDLLLTTLAEVLDKINVITGHNA